MVPMKQKTGGQCASQSCIINELINVEGASMKGSTLSRALFAIASLSMALQSLPLRAQAPSVPSGSYEMTVRLELPHLERWGVDKTTTICLSNSQGPDEIPVPVVSANTHSRNARLSMSCLMVRSSSTTLFARNGAPQGPMRFTRFRPTPSPVVLQW